MRNILKRVFNRYTVIVLWATPTGASSQQIKVFGRDEALNTATAIRFHGEGHCTVCVIGPCGGLC